MSDLAALTFESMHGPDGLDPEAVAMRRVQLRLGDDFIALSITFKGTYAKAVALQTALRELGSCDIALGTMLRVSESAPEVAHEGPAG